MQPAFVFAGEQFDSDAQLRLCKSMLLDLFRGRVVETINLQVWHRVSLFESHLVLRASLPVDRVACWSLRLMQHQEYQHGMHSHYGAMMSSSACQCRAWITSSL